MHYLGIILFCNFHFVGEDISESLDEGILRSQLVEGEGYQTPRDMSTCNGEDLGNSFFSKMFL